MTSINWPKIFLIVLVVLVVLIVTAMFPAGPRRVPNQSARRAAAKVSTDQLAAALNAYFVEYGSWPAFTGDGAFLDARRNSQLLRMLTAQDDIANPRQVLFFEGKIATKESFFSNRLTFGFDPNTGAFLDPWGNPYRVMLDADNDGVIESPYPDDQTSIHMPVIVWSLGKDGRQGAAPGGTKYRGSDDVASWR